MDQNKIVPLENRLSIFLMTYNRSLTFDYTLGELLKSPFKNCTITVMNNASTDNTIEVFNKYVNLSPDIKIVTNKFNIGGSGNILRSFEYCTTKYIWVLHDDDDFDFTQCDDVIENIIYSDFDLIQIGSFPNMKRPCNGDIISVRDVIQKGYNYFALSSFMPCNIIKASSFMPYLYEGYKNICNEYSHLPFLISLFNENKHIYISLNPIVLAAVGSQSYSNTSAAQWWIGSSKYLKNKKDKQLFFKAKLPAGRQTEFWLLSCMPGYFKNELDYNSIHIVYSSLNFISKIRFFLEFIPYFIIKKIVQKTQFLR